MARNRFNEDEELKTTFKVKYIARLFHYLKPYSLQMTLAVLLMLLSSVISMAGPLLLKIAIDEKIPSGDIKGLFLLGGLLTIAFLFNALCTKFKIRSMVNIGQGAILNLRTDLFKHLQKLPFTYYDSRPHGKILVRVVNYVNALSDLLTNGFINLITDIFSLCVIIIFMLFINVKLTFVCLAACVVLVAAVFPLKSQQRGAWQAISAKVSNMNAYIHESITGIKVTQSFGREEENLETYRQVNFDYRKVWMYAMWGQFAIPIAVEIISTLSIIAICILGVKWISTGEVTAGILIAFISYIGRFWGPINNLSNFYNSIITAMAYLERIFETMEEPALEDKAGAFEMPAIKGEVAFENVSFSYDSSSADKVLKDISFAVQPGQCIAFVGATGAGKTTIVNLLSRFYSPDSGKILIDEIDIAQVKLDSLQRQIGVMLQDSFIFTGTILENIRYGRLDASDEEVVTAARAVKAHDFIVDLPEGYNTEVNERGSSLSSGQRQLISFARVLLADPAILILDEATSNIDTKTELAVQEGIETLLKGRTSFVIAHRLSTIRKASKIYYIDNGLIVEQGGHEELMSKESLYRQLYNASFQN